MELISLLFRLGVLFAIYGFIWFFIDAFIRLLTSGRKRNKIEYYLIKSAKYLFLVNVLVLFCLNKTKTEITFINIAPTLSIFCIYLIGRLQNDERKSMIQLSFFGKQTNNSDATSNFNRRNEIILIIGALIAFVILAFNADYAKNNIAEWFYTSIIDIEETAIIGYIFKFIGLLFLISMIFKMIGALSYIINGGPMIDVKSRIKNKKDDEFDDYEEV
jgi:hypothetical protein